MLSAGGIRQQFSVPENIKMSMYGAEFIKKMDQEGQRFFFILVICYYFVILFYLYDKAQRSHVY